MQAKYIIIAILLIAAAAVVAGPAAAAASQYPMTVTDNFNMTATLAKAPERIVSLSPSNTELLFELGVGDKIVGTDDYSNYPAAAKNITHVSGFAEVSYEKITAVNPDLIFVDDVIGEAAVTKLRSMGFQVIELKNSNLTMLRKNIALMGMVTNTQDNATAIIAGIDAQVSQIAAKAAALNLSSKPNVLLLTGLYSDETIYPFGNGTYGDELITMAGGRNAAGGHLPVRRHEPRGHRPAGPGRHHHPGRRDLGAVGPGVPERQHAVGERPHGRQERPGLHRRRGHRQPAGEDRRLRR